MSAKKNSFQSRAEGAALSECQSWRNLWLWVLTPAKGGWGFKTRPRVHPSYISRSFVIRLAIRS